MKKFQKGSSNIGGLVAVFFVAAVFFIWGTNAYKLTQCDFESPFKCEIVHGIGVFGPLSLFTVWSDTDSKD